MDAKKKKKADEAQRKYEKKEIARRVKAMENRSNVESELESEDPKGVGDDMIFSEEEESREVIATSAERRDPVAASAAGEQEVERRSDVPMPRKRAASADAVGEREAKRPFGGVAGLVPICCGHGRASQAVRGAGLHPRILGARASARLIAGGCPASCSG